MLQDISKPAQINKQQLSKSDKGKKINGFDYSQVWYKDLFAVIEVKHKATAAEFNNAYVQLFMYTRNLYATQPNRRFAWGLVICGTMVEACVFGPNYAVASKKMDISTAEGRHEFVKLLTYWSFSEDYRLGYDPTMRRLKGLGCWEIEVPVCGDGNSKSNKTKVYYSNLMVTIAERLFGRHTRCFLATPDKPAIGKLLTVDDYSIFIKDAWPEADEDCSKDTRDEIRHLAKIKRMLGDKRPELEGMYPTIEAGGRVCIKHTGANSKAMLMQDTTRAILGDILEQSKATEMRALDTGEDNKDKDENAQMEQIVHVRVHKRIATTPIGQPISKAKSVFELLVIFADIMKCHNAVYKECNILHRDISMNNIMFRRTRDGVAGLLIDFDHSKDEEFDNGTVHDMRTGTMPFMSINNLENNSTRRTVLDDWESFIYILCWIGTYGYNSKTRRKYVSTYPLRIRHWVTDNMEANADAKRSR
ncbi:hypothetical protein LPJ64_006346 [Coemansia asiatica]|uniref:Protein kinase domain-containing protein n=1 Tax=Coemansia asiatica TaxID=1052880 RepID=A0A9W7XEQ4_9FUNG|nr:hypothetical protein LPJ64_006346 [Coemansia asiatica]